MVERLPGALPTLHLSRRDLSIVHLMDMPVRRGRVDFHTHAVAQPSWNDVAHLDLGECVLTLRRFSFRLTAR